ncbi:hypothetical protein [Pseudomonas poae]|uniref:Morphogenetic protein n=1 Tax=Pseudomonas poae TaxID=200451 RepID=A0ABY0RBI3_9PSED|nr:hypothetical protein [Pseudomonas poae]KRP44109.1 hypothetical protein TU75_22825 [Pseudomonas poae]SDN52258.1 hypothetical protein SAMN04490208_0578 [Pseudomonas poae]
MSQIKERPILFSAPMVRAILEGRKTVTRRAISVNLTNRFDEPRGQADVAAGYPFVECDEGYWPAINFCPYGKPGDRLWVRETWGVISHDFDERGSMIDWEPDRPASPIREMRFGQGYYSGHVIYRADGEAVWAGDDDGGGDDRSAWKPSIHMPRVASRLQLEITDVRVERLQDITEDQARAEGVRLYTDHAELGNWWHVEGIETYSADPRKSFELLWSSVGGDWAANPWVWVVEFKRVTP